MYLTFPSVLTICGGNSATAKSYLVLVAVTAGFFRGLELCLDGNEPCLSGDIETGMLGFVDDVSGRHKTPDATYVEEGAGPDVLRPPAIVAAVD